MKLLVYILPILGLFSLNSLIQAEDPILSWIETGDLENVEEFLQENDINSLYGKKETTLLVHAIIYGTARTTERIIELGADVNLLVDSISPLMVAAGMDELKKVSLLVNAQADIETQDNQGNTALFYAAVNGNLKITRYLARHGADLSHMNNEWKTPYDMAVINYKQEIAKFLRSHYEKNLPDLRDGPYISWKGKNTIRAFYIVHESESQATRKISAKFKADSDPYLLSGFSKDSLEYRISSCREVPPDHISGVDRIMVIGDIHGGYDSLLVFLKNNGVVDETLSWTWGDGHLVFVGDIFDRGEKVTEALWLIYKLEEQASKSGGAVHMILGNHEIMILTGNQNYVSDKYLLMTSKLNINYSWLFSKHTILGQWLRSKNTILKIDDHVFVHAGLSPKIMATGLDIPEINELVRYFLNHPDSKEHAEVSRNLLLGPNGPFWYRGYMESNHEYPHLPEVEFDRVLRSFNASDVFIGHTNVMQVTSFYDDRVYALDVPFYNYRFPMAGILIKDDVLYLLNSAGAKKQIR